MNSHEKSNLITAFPEPVFMAPNFDYKYYPANVNTITGFKIQSYKFTSYLKLTKHPNILAYLSILMLMQSGDLHPNPGPYKPKFPCGVCEKAVRWGQRATCCDQCDLWYHVDCMDMCSQNYEALQASSCSWICCQCGLPNFASSLFSDFSLNLSNNFASLTALSTDTDPDSIGPLSPPAATSSPKSTRCPSTGSPTKSCTNSSRHDNGKRSRNPNQRVKRQSLKTMVVNFGSIRGKVADLAVTLENYHPDIIIGTETHLNSSINSSELFPPDFSVYRKDRTPGPSGISKGGVLVAIRNDLVGTHRIDLDTDCEIVWVTVKIQGSKDVTVGAFYRSQIFGATASYMNELRESLSRIKLTKNSQIWLAGDFNFPDVNWDTLSVKPGGTYAGLSRQMIEIANDFGLEQVVREPTRGKNTLDLFFTTNPTLVERSTVTPGLSDHDGVPLIIISAKPRVIKQRPRKVYLYHKADTNALLSDLRRWSDEFSSRDLTDTSVNDMYEEFQNSLETAMDSHIPSKIVSKRNQTPWINKRVKRLHKRKQRAYNQYSKNRDEVNYEKFRAARKTTFRETRSAYRKYINEVVSDSPKKFWSFVKNLKVDSIGIPTLKKDGKLESDNRAKAEILNDQFKSVFTKENLQLPSVPELNTPTMPDIIISVEGVAKLLHDLNPNKASGPDNISARILKLAAEEIAPALSIIFQKSLDTGEIPLSWLRANITPLFKKGERTCASNYRPVSLTCICSKLLEHIIYSFQHYVSF